MILGLNPDKSTIDDGSFESKSPTSITKSTSQSNCSNISLGFDNISSSERFALVVVIGKILAKLHAIPQSGTLTPTLFNPLVTERGTMLRLPKINVYGPGKYL